MKKKVDLRPTEEMLAKNVVLNAYEEIKDYVSVLVITRALGNVEGRCTLRNGYNFDDLCALHDYMDYVHQKLVDYIGPNKLLIILY